MFELLQTFWDVVTHLDRHLAEWVAQFGGWLYLILFLVVFCETGLVVTPFLPGDSLLFAVGTLCALPNTPLSVSLSIPLLVTAAVLGDAVNYAFGYRIGPRVFASESSRLFDKRHLLRTQAFYERHGGKTIIIARFVPIIRTFAPFVAGVGRMEYRRFALFNVTGALLWVGMFIPAGYWFGNLPAVKERFHIVILAIIVLSVLPAVIELLRGWREARKADIGRV